MLQNPFASNVAGGAPRRRRWRAPLRASAAGLAIALLLALPVSAWAAQPDGLQVPALGLDAPVRHLKTTDNPVQVVAHYGGVQAGQPGTVVLGAHSLSLWGVLFSRLTELEPGDAVVLLADGESYRYTVTRAYYLLPRDWWRVYQRDGQRALVRLATCWGNGYWIVEAELSKTWPGV